MPPLAAETRLLCAAKRRSWVRYQPAVQADHSIIQPFTNLQSPLHIFREHIGHQSIFGIIGAGDDFLLGVKRQNCSDWAE